MTKNIVILKRSEVSKNENAILQNPLDISVSTKPQYDKAGGHNVSSPSIVGGDSTYSPSLCGGVRGWVDSTSALQAKLATASKHNTSVIASEQSERGNPQETLANIIDCHAFTTQNKRSAVSLAIHKIISQHFHALWWILRYHFAYE